MQNNSISAELVRNLFNYSEDSGIFTRKIKTGRNTHAGQIIGSYDMHGYLTTRINRVSYKLHRLAWLYVTGEMPSGDIDHINGDRTDNRFCNLRDVPRLRNLQNRISPNKLKKSGLPLGVFQDKSRFEAAISVNNKKISLGRFDTPEQASAAYLSAKAKMHVGFVASRIQ